MKITFGREDNYGEKMHWLELGKLRIHVDLNVHFPYGFCAGISWGKRWERDVGGDKVSFPLLSISMDLNAYHGEPNRIYMNGPQRHYMIGLISWHTFRETGRQTKPHPIPLNENRTITVIDGKHVRTWPHIVRGQRWDWEKSEGMDIHRKDAWRWIVVTPHDSHERWKRAHPEEAAEQEARHAEYRAYEAAYEARRSALKRLDASETSASPPQEELPSEE